MPIIFVIIVLSVFGFYCTTVMQTLSLAPKKIIPNWTTLVLILIGVVGTLTTVVGTLTNVLVHTAVIPTINNPTAELDLEAAAAQLSHYDEILAHNDSLNELSKAIYGVSRLSEAGFVPATERMIQLSDHMRFGILPYRIFDYPRWWVLDFSDPVVVAAYFYGKLAGQKPDEYFDAMYRVKVLSEGRPKKKGQIEAAFDAGRRGLPEPDLTLGARPL